MEVKVQHKHTHTHTHSHGKAGKTGIYLSMACAVHCVAMPFVLAALPAVGEGVLGHNPVLEIGLLLSCVVLCGWQLMRDYLRFHRKPKAIFLMLGGIVAIMLLRSAEYEMAAGLITAVAFGGASLLNHKLIHKAA